MPWRAKSRRPAATERYHSDGDLEQNQGTLSDVIAQKGAGTVRASSMTMGDTFRDFDEIPDRFILRSASHDRNFPAIFRSRFSRSGDRRIIRRQVPFQDLGELHPLQNGIHQRDTRNIVASRAYARRNDRPRNPSEMGVATYGT
jgi:hypothetical protein